MILQRALLAIIGVLANLSSTYATPPPGKILRIGVLAAVYERFDPVSNESHRALVEGLRALGYELGRHYTVEFRGSGSRPELLPKLAAELLQLNPDVVVSMATQPTLVLKDATKTIPIVMVGATDPAATGIVASLAHPGGNVTGLAVNAADISAKRVQFLKDAIPKLTRVAVLWNSNLKSMTLGFQQIERAAPGLGVTVVSIRVTGSGDFDGAFAAIRAARVGALVVLFGPMKDNDVPRIREFVTRNRIPTVFEVDRGAIDSALMEFGPGLSIQLRQAATYVDKIANGAKPADLPVEEPTNFVLILNAKVAKALGVTLPPSLLLRADRVIE